MAANQLERTDDFVARLRAIPVRKLASIRATCIAEIGYLKKTGKFYKAGSATRQAGLALSTVRRAISRYRNAIREQLGETHPALDYMRLKDDDQTEIHDRDRQNVVTRHAARRPLDVDRHIAIARSVLTRPAPARGEKGASTYLLELAAAVIAVTGRRPLEVFQDLTPKGDFRPAKTPDTDLFDRSVSKAHRWTVLFAGQRKTRDSENAQTEPYQIPVLVEPELVLNAIETLRSRYNVQDLTPDQVGGRIWKNLGAITKGGVYAERAGFPTLASPGYQDRHGEPLTPKDLRAAYACAAWSLFAPPRMSLNAYFARILGHSELDLVTSFSYDVFYPWGEAKGYDRASHDAALDTLAELEKELAREDNETIRARLADRIALVRERLEDD